MLLVFFLMIRRPPRSTRTDTLFPYTTLFRSQTSGVDETLESVIRLLRDELPARGFDPMRDVQVAASMRRGDVGIHALNTAIKGALNPSADDRFTVELRKRPFTVGDRVMQLRND